VVTQQRARGLHSAPLQQLAVQTDMLRFVGVDCSPSRRRGDNKTLSRFLGYGTEYIFIQVFQDYPEDVNSKLFRNFGTSIQNCAVTFQNTAILIGTAVRTTHIKQDRLWCWVRAEGGWGRRLGKMKLYSSSGKLVGKVGRYRPSLVSSQAAALVTIRN
jgi:hypothetical protein